MKRLPSAAMLAVLVASGFAVASDWTYWRGPAQQGVSGETGLVSSWSVGGDNVAWRAPFVGRSTPVVVDGRVCVIGRVGDGMEKQEVVACFDAESGRKLWEDRFNVYHTTVAFNRVGWAAMAADAETGYVYAHGVAGQLICYDSKGRIVWSRFLTEDFGRLSGYGGRTQTPLVDGNQLILTFVSSGWGEHAAPSHRYFSFDKKTGEVQWIAQPGGRPFDMNTQSAPVVAQIDGRRLLIAGNADGHVYAVDIANGNKVWSFALSRRGLNSTVLVAGNTVFASHSEENLDDATMGRAVAFKGTGSGDITGQELWRINELSAGFPSPAYLDGKLYVVDNSANLHRIDATTGKVEWVHGLGRVGKASPVLADGKLYVPETNGRFHILKPGKEGAEVLDVDEVKLDDGHYAEIYGSPAIASGRIYLSTESGLFCLGDKSRPVSDLAGGSAGAPVRGKGPAASLIVTPAEIVIDPGGSARFSARAFDAKGRPLGIHEARWQLEGLGGEMSADGTFSVKHDSGAQAGKVVATAGDLKATARVRVIPGLPWVEDFESYEVGGVPGHWIGARGKYKVVERDGQKMLAKLKRERGLLRNPLFMGGDFSNYTIEADVMGARIKRRVTDVGLINSGYTMDLLGNHQRLEVRSWTAERRMAQTVDAAWEPDVWYRAKFRVETQGGKGMTYAKFWKRGEPEPGEWTLTVEDPLPTQSGSPGLTGYSPADVYYDNIKVTVNR